MVAKITIPQSIRRALNYNEQKVMQGVATCIYARNFLKAADRLNFNQKLVRFESLIALNTRAKTNTVHISLNFGPDEKIEKEKLCEMASAYMEKIGFGEQPYLVYQHHDAGHPHIHIVTTNIQHDGKRISVHNLGRNQSAAARKQLENAYHLQKADERKADSLKELNHGNVQKVVYGKSATKRAITNVLDQILLRYKYSSLAELNSVLKLYNVCADRGSEDGIIYKKRGLVYRALDNDGNKIGVPIKASSIYSKPTLNYLEERFKINEVEKHKFKKKLKTSIDWIMLKPFKSLQAFKLALEKEKISLIVRQNENGIIYGLTYVDHNTKCVFNGSELGKEYSAKGILARCGVTQSFSSAVQSMEQNTNANILQLSTEKNKEHTQDLFRLLDGIISPSNELQYVPPELKKKPKKKRKSQ